MNATMRERVSKQTNLNKNLELNLHALSGISPELHNYLCALPGKALRSTLVLTHDDCYTRETINNGKKEYINSINAPWEEAELQLGTIPGFNKNACVHYFGIGLGYHLFLLLKKFPELKKILVYEQTAEWLFLTLSIHDFSEKIANRSLTISFDYTKQSEPVILRGRDDFIWINPAFTGLYEDFFKRKLSRFIEAEQSGSNTALVIEQSVSPSCRNLSASVSKEFKKMGWNAVPTGAGTNAIESGYFQYLPELLFSSSFSTRISKLAGALKVPYACWEIDKVANPEIFQPGSLSPYTYIFTPFYEDVMKFQFAGAQAFYLPPVPTADISLRGKKTDDKEARHTDISYIDSLSTYSEITLAKLIKKIEDLMDTGNSEVKEEGEILIKTLRHSLKRQKVFTGKNIYRLPDILVDELNKMPALKFFSFNPHLLHYVLGRESGALQALSYLKSLAPRIVSIYGDSVWKTARGSNLRYMGYANLNTDFQNIVRKSKINIGISPVSQLDGFNDTPFNILKSGGFFLTNRTHLIEESFEIDKELVIFESPDELKGKCEYYLREERERIEIAEKGMQRVNRDHTTESRLKRILELVPVRKQDGYRRN